MCGRFALQVTDKPDLSELSLPFTDRYNIAPQAPIAVLDDSAEITVLPWDYSPSWARSPMHLFNARSESLRERPSFQAARRCVVLADGWYEWQQHNDSKHPWYHHIPGERLYFAGLYGADSGAVIVTRASIAELSHIHPRQPVLLDSKAIEPWLDGHDLFASAISHHVQCYRVSSEVNSTRSDHRGLIAPMTGHEPPPVGSTGDLFGP